LFNYCGCSGAGADQQCRTGNSGGNCSPAFGVCQCGGTVCRAGEVCAGVGGRDQCSCNGGLPCAGSTEACCQNPPGCRNLLTDALNCGACGRSCPPGFACTTGACRCTADQQCNAGGGGTCVNGACACGGVTCSSGKRCQPGGACG
jgi:hypothetical protein